MITKRKIEQKKRGRKTNKIQLALENLPFEPIPLLDASTKYNVSKHCLKQWPRFNKSGVKVKIFQENNIVYIHQEA